MFKAVRAAKAVEAKRGKVDQEPSTVMSSEARWVNKHLTMRECFCAKPARKPKKKKGLPTDPCECGRSLQDPIHREQLSSGQEWHVNSCTEVNPTNAFGEIEFVNFQNTAKYVRIAQDSDPKVVVRLLLLKWNLPRPRLLISITGGAKNFVIQPHLKDLFYRGLTKAAATNDAWIVTGGNSSGVMEHVGKAARLFNTLSVPKDQVTVLGIAPWGCVAHRNRLEKSDGTGQYPAKYRSVPSDVPSDSTLDGNHTHFLLVDNGTVHKYGTEIEFRAKFESTIATSPGGTVSGNDSFATPIVLILLEGGPGSLKTVYEAVLNNTPVVIVAGSGRAANVLARAYALSTETLIPAGNSETLTSTIDSAAEVEIRKLIVETFGDDGEQGVFKNMEMIRECLRQRSLITIFEQTEGTKDKQLDYAILEALLKANRDNVIDQLRLALAWNRIDIAKQQIFNNNDFLKQMKDNSDRLEEVLFGALIDGKTEFVELILEQVDLMDFLTIERLLSLYEESITVSTKSVASTLLRKLTNKKSLTLSAVGDLIQDLVGEFYQPLYLEDDRYKDLPSLTELQEMSETTGYAQQDMGSSGSVRPDLVMDTPEKPGHFVSMDEDGNKVIVPSFDEPWRELFIWSVLQNRTDMALFFLKEGKDMMPGCLLAARMLYTLAGKTPDKEMRRSLEKNAEDFQERALGILGEMYESDDVKARKYLIRKLHTFGDTTTLTLAVVLEHKDFISHSCCQLLLSSIWMGEMSDETSRAKMLLTAVFPFLSMTPFIKYKRDEEEARRKEDQELEKRRQEAMDRYEEGRALPAPDKRDDRSRSIIALESEEEEDEGPEEIKRNRLSPLKRFFAFFQAPSIIFMYNCASYMSLLILYSFVMLCWFETTISWREGLLIFWLFTLLIEEIRQLVSGGEGSTRMKVQNYFYDGWNILDVLCIGTFLIGLILRLIPNEDCFVAARIILALNLAMFFYRVLHIFSVFQNLGPKLVMIGKMMKDLIFFIVILMVFIVSFGIVQHIILFPNSQLEIGLVNDVLRMAYWQMFGELFLEDIEKGADDCTSDPNLYLNNTFPRCPTAEGTWLNPILLGLYLMLSNVLMLNLLIAIFSNTYDSVNAETDQTWHFQRYHLIREYWSRPVLAPPLIFISHLYLAVKMCIARCCGKCIPSSNNEFLYDGEGDPSDRQMITWETVQAREYFRKSDETERLALEGRMRSTQENVESVRTDMGEVQKQFNVFNNMTQEGGEKTELGKRLLFLEKQLERTTLSLDWVIKSMQKTTSGLPALPAMPDPVKEREKELLEKDVMMEKVKAEAHKIMEEQLHVHVKSRTSPYPASGPTNIVRLTISDRKVSWKSPMDDYHPPVYTDPILLKSPPPAYADAVDLLSFAADQRERAATILFNTMDNVNNVDRRSYLGEYKLMSGVPLNPQGRTGLQGRGMLGRWGPNHAVDIVVSRFKRDKDGAVVKERNKPILEFVSVQRKNTKELSITGGFPKGPEKSKGVMKEIFISKALGGFFETELTEEETFEREQSMKILEELFSQPGQEVYRGYADDPRNTDNAWIETVAYSFHDESGKLTAGLSLKAGTEVASVGWRILSSRDIFYGAHEVILRMVADRLKVYF